MKLYINLTKVISKTHNAKEVKNVLERIVTLLFLIVGIIHVLPVSGVLGADQLSVLYGVSLSEPNIIILMRHRAVLLGLLGLFLIYAAFKPFLQPLAFLAGFTSVISFIVIAWSIAEYNVAVQKVVIADLIAVFALFIALVCYIFNRKKTVSDICR